MGKKKTKTSATETSRTVTTPTRPDWVDAQARGLNKALTGLGAQDPAAGVAPLSDLERRATEGAAGLGVGAGWGAGGTDWAGWGRPATPGPQAPDLSGAALAGRLGAVSARTFVLVGERDTEDRIRSAKTIAAGIPGAELALLPDASRFLHIEESRAVMRRLTDFFLPEPEIER